MSTAVPLGAGFSEAQSTHASRSGVSWGAIAAGAAAAAALSLVLLILGTGLGMSSVSPWSGQGVSGTTFGVSTILWLTFTQIAASGMGGYLAGRLRSKWSAVHGDEVYFRDTAHGFLAWAVATLATAALLGSVIGSIVSGGAQAGAAAVGGVAKTAAMAAPAATKGGADDSTSSASGYLVDSLFRKDANAPAATSAGTDDPARSAAEVSRILVNAFAAGSLSAEDTRYVGQLVSQRTGVAQPDAEKRVADTFAKAQAKLKETEAAARDAADKTRKATAYGALWLFVSLLIGAFTASWAATFGGRRRDLF